MEIPVWQHVLSMSIYTIDLLPVVEGPRKNPVSPTFLFRYITQ